jgi:exopolysaccharide biosynthesis polyprenyl glycosylphosphotransferase
MTAFQLFDSKVPSAARRQAPLLAGFTRVNPGILLGVADITTILAIPAAALWFATAPGARAKNGIFWLLLTGITVLLIASLNGYRREMLRNPAQGGWLAVRCYVATSIAMLSAAVLLGHPHAVSRVWTTAELLAIPLALALLRTLPALAQAAARPASGPLVVCYDRCRRDLGKALAAQKIFEPVSGVLYLAPCRDQQENAGWTIIPTAARFLDLVQSHGVQDVIFIYQPELDLLSPAFRQTLLAELLTFPARIWLAFDLEPQLPAMLTGRNGHYRLVPMVNDSLVNAGNPGKRAFDLVFGSLLLFLALPLLCIIAVLVRLSGPGPVIFRQVRTGAHGHRFTVLKFRTMRHDAGTPFTQATRHDPRVTWIGRFLRRSSLDELLQLVNVIKGDMSLVGPRPQMAKTAIEATTFEAAVKLYRLRHRVKPGMTGLAQIRGQRGETKAVAALEARLASDLEYIETWSLLLDFLILLRTLPALLLTKNAY